VIKNVNMQVKSGRAGRRGFTLLEVLIGVLVLSLALLGLAAMFPVVVRTQRIARDTVVGTGVLETAEATLHGHDFFRSLTANVGGLQKYSDQLERAPNAIETKWEVSLDTSVAIRRLYTNNGSMSLSQGLVPLFPASNRLNLMPGIGAGTDPTLVWDLAMCLATETDVPPQPTGEMLSPLANVASMSRTLRVAIFVRRIDSQIRLRSGQSMLDGFVTGTYVPIGASAASFGDPTLDGTGQYSLPMWATVSAARQSKTNGPYDIFQLLFADNGRLPAARALAKPGQIVIDNQGGIHTVARNVRDAAGNPIYNQVLLEKPMLETTADRCNEGGSPIQLTFTEQVPVAARVITVRP
jgi:prepilin-type N-terminal cleavage/methylation domain-containing protein